MRVSFVSGSYPPIKCGIGDYTARLAQALGRLGASTAMVTSANAGVGKDGRGIEMAPVAETWNWGDRRTVIKALTGQMPDVVNIQYPTQNYGRQPMINFLPFFIRRSLKIPVVFTVHEFSSFTWLGRLRIALSAILSDGVIVPDRENLALMAKTFPFLQKKLHHVPIGPNIERASDPDFSRQEWRLRHGVADDNLVIAFFGFLSPSKGVETLLEALERVASDDKDISWRLLLIADRLPSDERYADYHSRIEKRLESSPIRNRVDWTGYCSEEDVSRHLMSSDICVLPFSDGASMRRTTLLSALGHGLPLVSTYPQGRLDPELQEGKNVVLVPPDSAMELARSIAHLAGDREKRLRLSEGARELAIHLSWEEIGRRTLAAFEAARGRKGVGPT